MHFLFFNELRIASYYSVCLYNATEYRYFYLLISIKCDNDIKYRLWYDKNEINFASDPNSICPSCMR